LIVAGGLPVGNPTPETNALINRDRVPSVICHAGRPGGDAELRRIFNFVSFRAAHGGVQQCGVCVRAKVGGLKDKDGAAGARMCLKEGCWNEAFYYHWPADIQPLP